MKLQRFWDRVFLGRPALLVPVWTFLLLGNYHAFPTGFQMFLPGAVLVAFVTYSMLMAGIYVLNQICDRESDRLNRKLFLIPEGHIGVASAAFQAMVLIGVSVLLASFFSVPFLLFFAMSVALGLLYSVPPFKLKGRPVLDMAANAVGYGFLNFGVGWLATRDFSVRMIELSLPYALAIAAVYLNTTILDISGDREAGDITTGVWLGPKNTGILAAVLMAAALVISLLVRNYICFCASVIALPLFLWTATKAARNRTLISVRVGAAILVLAVCILYPLFLGVLVLGFFLTRWYYRSRFGVVYPSILEPRR